MPKDCGLSRVVDGLLVLAEPGQGDAEPGGGVGCRPEVGLQVDVEGLPVAGLGLVEPPLFLRDPAELVVGAGGGVPVAGLQEDVEGLPVAGLGLVEPPLFLRDPAELVVGAGGGVPVAGLQLMSRACR